MKKKLFIVLFFINNALFASEVPQAEHYEKAQHVIDLVMSFGNGLPDDITDFLKSDKISLDLFNPDHVKEIAGLSDVYKSANFLYVFINHVVCLIDWNLKQQFLEIENLSEQELESLLLKEVHLLAKAILNRLNN